MSNSKSEDFTSKGNNSWRQVIAIDRKGAVLGLSKGAWMIKSPVRFVALDRANIVELLPFLEMDPQVWTTISQAARSESLAYSCRVETFVDDLLLVALESASTYWQELALKHLQKPIASGVLKRLEFLAEKGLTQDLRHQARRIVREANGMNEVEGADANS